MDSAAEQLGRLDVLVNNAGVFRAHPPMTTSYDDWQAGLAQTLATNLVGAANATFCAVPHLRAAGGGAVVNVSSRGAFRGEPDNPAYGASKAGLNAFGQSMALVLAPHGISVGTVAPGFVQTEMAREVLDGPGGDAVRAQSPVRPGGPPRRRSPPRCCGWPRRRPGSRPARSSTSTARPTCAAEPRAASVSLASRRTRRRSCRIRRLPATAARKRPAAVAISRETASGALPDQPRNDTLTLWVFWAMKMTSRISTTPSPSTAAQMPLVRDPRNGSLALGAVGAVGAAGSGVVAASASGPPGRVGSGEGVGFWSCLLLTPGWEAQSRARVTQPAATRDTATAHSPRPSAWARCTCSRSTVAASRIVKAG